METEIFYSIPPDTVTVNHELTRARRSFKRCRRRSQERAVNQAAFAPIRFIELLFYFLSRFYLQNVALFWHIQTWYRFNINSGCSYPTWFLPDCFLRLVLFWYWPVDLKVLKVNWTGFDVQPIRWKKFKHLL